MNSSDVSPPLATAPASLRMNSSVEPASPPVTSGPALREVDASLRWAAFALLTKAGFWLLVGSFLLLVSSVKLHGPGLLSGAAWLTYGRLWPAGWEALVYGGLGQAGFAVGLWILARACRQRLQVPPLVLAGAACWNVGTLVGVVGILAGAGTGREWLQLPAGALALLVVGAGLIGTAGWLTYAARSEGRPYPSAWFVLLALLAMVWLGTVALMMFSGEGARGVVQVLVQRWYAGGVTQLWLGGLTLAVLFHFLPLMVDRPLASRPLASIAFWSLVFFAPWAVTSHGDPFPRWMVSAGLAGRTLAAIGLVAVALNLGKTMHGLWRRLWETVAGRLLGAAAIAYVAGGALQFLTSLRGPSSVTGMTWLVQGLDWLWVASVVLAFSAVIPELVRRSCDHELSPTWVAAHAWLSLLGLGLIALPLLVAGWTQGAILAGRDHTFMDALRGSLLWVRLSSLGYTVLFLAQVALVIALVGWVRAWLTQTCASFRSWVSTPIGKGAEVRS